MLTGCDRSTYVKPRKSPDFQINFHVTNHWYQINFDFSGTIDLIPKLLIIHLHLVSSIYLFGEKRVFHAVYKRNVIILFVLVKFHLEPYMK